MKIQTPLKIGAGEKAAGGGARLVVLPGRGPKPLPGRVLRALAASVAHLSTIEALKVSIKTREAPWEALEAYASKTTSADLQSVLDALADAKLDTTAEPNPDLEPVTKAVSADPAMVAAAIALLDGQDKKVKAAMGWVASVDRAMLEAAARAAASDGLSLVPVKETTKPVKGGSKVEAQLQIILDKLGAMEARLTDIDQRLTAVENP